MKEVTENNTVICLKINNILLLCIGLAASSALFVLAVYEITALTVPIGLVVAVLAISLLRCLRNVRQEMKRVVDEMEMAWKMKQNVEISLHKQMAEIEDGLQEANRSKRAFLNVLEDFRQEKIESEAARKYLDTIVDGVADGIMVIDEKGNIALSNRVVAEWMQLDTTEMTGKPWDKIMNLVDESGQSHREPFAQFIEDPKVLEDPHFVTSLLIDGNERPLSISASKMHTTDGNCGTVLVLRDVEAERKLLQAKNDFVSIASHQLRTPLTSINWQIESILGGDFGEIDGELREALDLVYSSGMEMNALIVALLNVARVDMGYMRIRPESVNLDGLCHEIMQEVSGFTQKKDLNIEYSAEQIGDIPLDKNLVKIVIENLITNAIRYTPAGGNIKVQLKMTDENAQVEVIDNGIGIPEDQQGKIFDKLFRADNVLITAPQGTGLGLYITKAVVTEMGGAIDFSSKEGQGSTFRLSLPLRGSVEKDGRQSLLSMCQDV